MKGNFLNRIEVDKSLRKTLLFHDAFPFCAQIFYIKKCGDKLFCAQSKAAESYNCKILIATLQIFLNRNSLIING